MNLFLYQIKQAYFSLKQKPGFVFSVVSTMGITLGALLCVLTLAYVMLVKPLPYPEQDKLYVVEHDMYNEQGVNNLTAFTYPSLIHLYDKQQVFAQAAILNYESNVITSIPDQPLVATTFVTPEWFLLLNASFELGHGFTQTEAINTHNPVVVLSYETWKNEFNSDSHILAKTLTINGVSFRIIGVLAKSVIEPKIKRGNVTTGVWLPWDFNSNTFLSNKWGNIRPSFVFVGKLKNGMSINQAEQSITPLVNKAWTEHVLGIEFFKDWHISMRLSAFSDVILGDSKGSVYLLLAGFLGLLVIAATNISSLFMSRTVEQFRHLTIHLAVGAKNSNLFSHLFFEAMLLMIASTIIAMMIAAVGFIVTERYLSSVLPRIDELSINVLTLFAALVLCWLLAHLFARLSRNMLSRNQLIQGLQASGKGTGLQISKSVRQTIMASQVAIASTLFFASIVLLKDATHVIQQPLGFEVDNMRHLSFAKSATEDSAKEENIALMKNLADKLAILPAIKSISRSSSPLGSAGLSAISTIEDDTWYTIETRRVDDAYFPLIKQTLLEGRFFSTIDVQDNNKQIIINDEFARQLTQKTSAIGKRFRNARGEVFTIIGVVKAIQMPGEHNLVMRVYLPEPLSNTRLLLKLHDDMELSRTQVLDVLKTIDKNWVIFNYENLEDTQQHSLFIQITTAIIAVCLALISLLLVAVGLYGILSYSTQMRRFELGTRMAIGAKGKDIISLVVKDNASALLIGIGVSVLLLTGLYLGFSDSLASYLSLELIPLFIITLAAISLLSFIACYLPLRQYIYRPAIHSLRGND